ncbi:TPA: hypothetical protein NKV14_003174 [Vibrio parahaemolyticus]|nr:hypothetical protein [Vibrio parahaemolyticus]HCH3707021.1 hypothetical protein [Vibrio parahaemolyticus]HCM1229833.1 hypothetical protein [Vibrio parahaemolyticus]
MFIALEKLKMNNDKRVGTGVDEISQLLKNGKFVSLSRLNENFQSKLDALKVTFPSLEVKECAHGLSVELFDPESHKVSDKSESSLKNHYGDNVAWFCYEASLVDGDFQHDDLIPEVLEIICDNGGSIDIDVRKLFESAHVVIEKQEDKIKELKENDKRSFFSGLAVALQSLSLWNQKTIADEIVDGLGSEKEPFYSYLESEGGIDAQTLEFLKGQE